MGQELEPMV